MLPHGAAIDKSISHILDGLFFSILGLWHLINHIKLFISLPPTSSPSYAAPAWLPAPRVRHLELIAMLASGIYGIATQMLAYTQLPFTADGSIPPERLPNHEHAIMYASLLVYAASAIYLDRRRRRRHTTAPATLVMLLLAAVFAQELFVFHVHSTDHAGVEGRQHWFLQAAAATCLATALVGAAAAGDGIPAGLQFAVSLVRSAAIAFQGLWGVLIGVVWIPGMAPHGCFLDDDDGGVSLRCHEEDGLRHAIAVVNLQFGWCFVLVTVVVLGVYVYVCEKYMDNAGEVYRRLPEADAGEEDDDHHHDMKTCNYCNCKKAVHGVHEFTSLEIEV